MTKAARAKRMATNYPVPQSTDDCDDMIRALGDVRREIARIDADMGDKLAETKEKFETRAQPLKEKAEELLGGVETFCAANRDRLTNGGKVKFATLKNGEVKWRVRPPKVTVRGKDNILDALRELGLSRFIRVKEDINKEAMLEEPDAVKSIKGLTIGSEGEDFVVEPFESSLSAADAS